MDSFKDTTKFLLTLSEKASEIMLRHFSPIGVPAQKKDDRTVVTAADIEINKMVIEMVREHYPSYGVYGEEESHNQFTVKKLFVVDPIDGTLMFAKGSPNFGFSIALVEDGVPVAGLLSNPLVKRTLIAEEGKGTYFVEGNVRVHVSGKMELKGAVINSGWRQSLVPRVLLERGSFVPSLNSIAEIAALIAVGSFDGQVFTWMDAYDVAAAKIVIEEAGGKVTDLVGNEQRYDDKIYGAVLSNGRIHNELILAIKESGLLEISGKWGVKKPE